MSSPAAAAICERIDARCEQLGARCITCCQGCVIGTLHTLWALFFVWHRKYGFTRKFLTLFLALTAFYLLALGWPLGFSGLVLIVIPSIVFVLSLAIACASTCCAFSKGNTTAAANNV